MKKKVKALIPMKGHNARVPNKNIRDFCGKPLFCRILEVLSDTKYIEQIVVDTDSKKIKELVRKHYGGVTIIDRPRKLCGDYVSVNKIIQYDIAKIEGKHFIQTHVTNPLLQSSAIEKAIEKYFSMLDKGRDSLFSVIRIQARIYDKGGKALNHDVNNLIRTQDMPPIFEENSNFYIFSRGSFKNNNNSRIGVRPYLYELNKMEAIDIDDKEDFKLAELIYKFKILDKNI